MEKLLYLISATVLMFISAGCTKTRNCNNCEKGTLYYTPLCSSIQGHVIFDDGGACKVFQDDIPEKFRHDSIKVCIKYKVKGARLLTAECAMGSVIKITCIEEQ